MRVTHTFLDGYGTASYDPEDESFERVAVGDRRLVPRRIEVRILGGTNQPDYDMKIEVRKGIPQWTEVTIRARPDGPEVRDKDLGVIPLANWLDQIVGMCSIGTTGGRPRDDWSTLAATADIRRVKSGRPRISDELLQQVAKVYRDHIDDRPTEAVATAFDKDRRTAARYVRLARNAGFLPDTTQGKRKA